jgi:biopolymer transport protein ExbD
MIDFRRKSKKELMSEINIIPFTDVVLVILIIFMITTPMLVQSSIKVNLPETALNSPREAAKTIEISVKDNGEIFLNDQRMADIVALRNALVNLPIQNSPVVVKGDRQVNYGVVAQVLGTAQKLGAKGLELQVQYKKDPGQP